MHRKTLLINQILERLNPQPKLCAAWIQHPTDDNLFRRDLSGPVKRDDSGSEVYLTIEEIRKIKGIRRHLFIGVMTEARAKVMKAKDGGEEA